MDSKRVRKTFMRYDGWRDGDCSQNACLNGSCVECLMAAVCPGQDNECQTRTCSAGKCGFNYVAQGTRTAMQKAGDVLEFAAEDWSDHTGGEFPKARTIDELRGDLEFQEAASDAVIAAVPFRVKAEAAE